MIGAVPEQPDVQDTTVGLSGQTSASAAKSNLQFGRYEILSEIARAS